MLLNFEVSNWMSFKDTASLNLTSSLERQHRRTLAQPPRFRSLKVLPTAAIYGGNASGKTSLFQALDALRTMITKDVGIDGTLPMRPFALDDNSFNAPTSFDITFLADDEVYRFTLEGNSEQVLYESLEIVREKRTIEIYERDPSSEGGFIFNEALFTDLDHLKFVAKSTRDNQVFLGRAMADNVTELSSPFGWFSSSLELVGLGSGAWAFATALGTQEGFLDFAGEMLSLLDTGISRLEGQPVALDALPPDVELRRSIKSLRPDQVLTLVANYSDSDFGFEMFMVRSVGGEPDVQRLGTVHVGPDGNEHRLSLGAESAGTRRLMVLMPMLFELSNSDNPKRTKVFVVDELDRCLHTMLTARLLEDFLENCGADTRKQLLFTNHDLLLMDQSLLRRDEMYVTQRDEYGCSELIGLSEYEGIRKDKDLVKSYLNGRFGGIPMVRRAGSYD